jgi:Uma2 family endonuclease
MCATLADPTTTLLLFDVPWAAYTGLIDALPEHRIPHTYDEGTLELFKNVVYDVPWGAYEQILRAFGDRRFPHTYQEGALELMMSPSEEHEQIKSFLGRLIELAALELGIHFKAVGSATQRDKKLLQGLEPDESYYIPYLAPTRRKSAGSFQKKSPPDLAIEVDLRKLDLERMDSYAKLGIRELWRYRNGKVEFFCLSSKRSYDLVSQSLTFPMIASKDVTRFVKKMRATDDYSATRLFVAWLAKKHRDN